MGFGECLAGTRIMLQMRIDIVAPLVRHSDLRDRPVDLSHPPCARHYAHDRVALQWLVRLALPDIGIMGATVDAIDDQIMTVRSEEQTSELQSLIRNSYAVFCLNKKIHKH